MGMAASQVRLLQLTSRKNTIGRELESLSLQKTSLTRDMRRVSKDYQDALNTKTLKWSNNAGATYVDLSYKNLMTPSIANKNTPYLLTNTDGRVVVDSKYEKYAQMISQNGASGGDWASNRTEILTKLIPGLTAEEVELSNAASATRKSATEEVVAAKKELKEKEATEFHKDLSQKDFITKVGSVSYVPKDSKNPTSLNLSGGGTISLGDSSNATRILKTITTGIANNMENYLRDDDFKDFQTACESFYNEYAGIFEAKGEMNSTGTVVSGNSNEYKLDVTKMMEYILGAYENCENSGKNSQGNTTYYTIDKTSSSWQKWNEEYNTCKTNYENAQNTYNSAVKEDTQVLTASLENEIAFYDQLFTAIAENGWECNSEVEDNNYLNQMLQNNQFFITTMDKKEDEDGKEYYEYNTDIASNFNNIYTVNDSSVQNEALANYEYEKSIINEKESRIDQRMTNLQTEQSAISNMIKGIETVEKDNIDRTFSIFS